MVGVSYTSEPCKNNASLMRVVLAVEKEEGGVGGGGTSTEARNRRNGGRGAGKWV